MNLFEKIDDVLDQENSILPKRKIKMEQIVSFDERMFSRIVEFIIDLNPDLLTVNQVQEVINIIEEIENYNINESPRLANRSSVLKNNASKKWYRENKHRVKNKKEEFERSKEGRKKSKNKEKNKGKEDRKSKYHTRKKSNRNSEYEKREYGE